MQSARDAQSAMVRQRWPRLAATATSRGGPGCQPRDKAASDLTHLASGPKLRWKTHGNPGTLVPAAHPRVRPPRVTTFEAASQGGVRRPDTTCSWKGRKGRGKGPPGHSQSLSPRALPKGGTGVPIGLPTRLFIWDATRARNDTGAYDGDDDEDDDGDYGGAGGAVGDVGDDGGDCDDDADVADDDGDG